MKLTKQTTMGEMLEYDMGIAYILTVPVTGIFFLRARARYERMQPLSAPVQE